MNKVLPILFLIVIQSLHLMGQHLAWYSINDSFSLDPKGSIHAFKTIGSLNEKPFIASYVSVSLCDKNIVFDTDTTANRRLTPSQFYIENNKPEIVVNGTFFSFTTNENLNLVIDDGHILSNGNYSIPRKDTALFLHPLQSAIGISTKRKADIAWVYSDKKNQNVFATQSPLPLIKNEKTNIQFQDFKMEANKWKIALKKWKMQTAIGGGPVLIQDGKIAISNDAEWKFAGKAINDKHPRTAMGYTADNRLIILVVQGRSPDASGASLIELAQIMKELNCKEAINLDGGGSTCLLINGKEAIKPSDATGQRSIPAVFIVSQSKN
jgi:exopolysaccharide biosynthesis protein